MIRRCSDPTRQNFHKYGGRGIQVCERWKTSFTAFLEDVGTKPTPKHSVDRIEVNGNYEPGNVRWATPQEQAWNTRQNVRYEWNGQSLTLGQWSTMVGLKRSTISARIHLYKWTVEQALTTPLGKSPK
jgi:hypothetical protein